MFCKSRTSGDRIAKHVRNGAHMNENETTRPIEAPLGQLEQALIDQFMRARGYDSEAIEQLSEADRRTLMAEASVYASGKLMEVEARSQFLDELRHGTPDTV